MLVPTAKRSPLVKCSHTMKHTRPHPHTSRPSSLRIRVNKFNHKRSFCRQPRQHWKGLLCQNFGLFDILFDLCVMSRWFDSIASMDLQCPQEPSSPDDKANTEDPDEAENDEFKQKAAKQSVSFAAMSSTLRFPTCQFLVRVCFLGILVN